MPVAELETIIGGPLTLTDAGAERSIEQSGGRANFAYAGGLFCAWNDAEGTPRAGATLVPNAQAAARTIADEFESGSDPVIPLYAHCVGWACESGGFVDEYRVSVFAGADQPGADAEAAIVRVSDSLRTVLAATGPAGPLPPLSTDWADGPTSCEEMLPAAQFAAHLGDDSLVYSPGYAYEDSNGGDNALLSAGGFICRYRSAAADGVSGTIAVLPDAAATLARVRAHSDGVAAVDIEGAPDADAVVSCWNNGNPAWSAGSTGRCTVHMQLRGAWVQVSAAETSLSEAEVTERARIAAAPVAAALG
ncbi:hypothetical protein GY24_12205 [Microterricola pindariensis]|uniref:Uncharacterized protein n=1 Tax=Microterricola pindariensis TaxID=478010 RepID=A0ABX5AV20_9MICO|nr:hypothetical protein GY24_12205 [Microterricola pindariensis]